MSKAKMNRREFATFLIAVGKVMLRRGIGLMDVIDAQANVSEIDRELLAEMVSEGIDTDRVKDLLTNGDGWAMLRGVPAPRH